MFFKYILLTLSFLLNCLDAMALDGPSQNQITALLAAIESEQINVALLRGERSESITLIGHINMIDAEDARIIGKIVKETLKADDSCILSGACTSLSKGLPFVSAQSGQYRRQVIKNIETASGYLSPLTIKSVDKLLGFVANGAFLFSSFLTVYDYNFGEEIRFNDYPDLRRTFDGCHNSAEKQFYGPVCVDGQMGLIRDAMAAQRREQQAALASSQTYDHNRFLNFYSVLVYFVAQGARDTLRWIYPHAATTTADDITKGIVNLLRSKQKSQVIALVPLVNFATIKNQLQALYFEEVDLRKIAAKKEEAVGGK